MTTLLGKERLMKSETGAVLGISEKGVENLIKGGRLDVVRIGRRVFVLRESVERLLADGYVPARN